MKVLVTGHGKYASGMKSLVETLIGSDDRVLAIDYCEGKDYADFEKEIESIIKENEKLIVFADITGGTPFQVSSRIILADDSEGKIIVSGVSVACMLDILMNTIVINDFSDIREKIKNGIERMTESVLVLSKEDILYE